MDQHTAKYIIVIGVVIVAAGVLVYFFHDWLHWLGRLPGDIRVTRGNFRFYFPVTTMILISLLLTLLFSLIRKWL